MKDNSFEDPSPRQLLGWKFRSSGKQIHLQLYGSLLDGVFLSVPEDAETGGNSEDCAGE